MGNQTIFYIKVWIFSNTFQSMWSVAIMTMRKMNIVCFSSEYNLDKRKLYAKSIIYYAIAAHNAHQQWKCRSRCDSHEWARGRGGSSFTFEGKSPYHLVVDLFVCMKKVEKGGRGTASGGSFAVLFIYHWWSSLCKKMCVTRWELRWGKWRTLSKERFIQFTMFQATEWRDE